MSLQGKFYLVAVKQNDIEHIRQLMLHSYGLKSEVSAISILIHVFLVVFFFRIYARVERSPAARRKRISLCRKIYTLSPKNFLRK